MQASSARSRGDTDTKRKYEKISMALTVVAIVTQVLGFIIVVGTAVGIVVQVLVRLDQSSRHAPRVVSRQIIAALADMTYSLNFEHWTNIA